MQTTVQIDITAESLDHAIAAAEQLLESQFAPLTDQEQAEGEQLFGFTSEAADVTASVLFGALEPESNPLGLGLPDDDAADLAELAALPL